MSEIVTLTMEVMVSKDQLPPNYTGRLLWRKLKAGDSALSPDDGQVKVSYHTAGAYRPVVEVKRKWEPPVHLVGTGAVIVHRKIDGYYVLRLNKSLFCIGKDDKVNDDAICLGIKTLPPLKPGEEIVL